MPDDMKNQFLAAYDAYAEAIFRHCYFRVFSRSRAEELMQETFMRFWHYLNNGKKVGNPRAFLYRIATNLVIDESRKRKEESLEAITVELASFEPKGQDSRDIEKHALLQEIAGALKKLPPGYREVLILRYIDDFDPGEIAQILQISASSVSVKLNRAMKSLRKHVQ